MREEVIFSRYGTQGITEYDLSNDVEQISDDTQMTLFRFIDLYKIELDSFSEDDFYEGYLLNLRNDFA